MSHKISRAKAEAMFEREKGEIKTSDISRTERKRLKREAKSKKLAEHLKKRNGYFAQSSEYKAAKQKAKDEGIPFNDFGEERENEN